MPDSVLELMRRAEKTVDDVDKGLVDTATGVIRRIGWIRDAVSEERANKKKRDVECLR